MSERPTKLDRVDARQGRSGLGVSRVLAWGLVLIVVIFVVLFFVLRAMPVHQ
jgi:hypothetical protein